MQRVKEWFIRNKETLLFIWTGLATGVAIIFGIILLVLGGMSEDLVGQVNDQKKTLKENTIAMERLKNEKNYAIDLYNALREEYSSAVPLQVYIQDVEYLESVILELRYQCELALNENCNC